MALFSLLRRLSHGEVRQGEARQAEGCCSNKVEKLTSVASDQTCQENKQKYYMCPTNEIQDGFGQEENIKTFFSTDLNELYDIDFCAFLATF